jgi:glycerate 2-kinase
MSAKHLLKNYTAIATTGLRRDACSVLEAGLRAIETQNAVQQIVSLKQDILLIGKKTYRLKSFRRVFVIGIGKASLEAAKALEKILGDKITDGIILDVKKGTLKHMKSIVGTHPFPSYENIRATGEIVGLLKAVDSQDLVITIVSGGGSALLCWPYQLECYDITAITKVLMQKGATIQEMNTVRKHISEIQGGQFVRLAFPATVVGLIFSDVPGDDLSMVASGPTFLDTTTAKDAKRILEKYQVLTVCKLPQCHLIETPKDPYLFERVSNFCVVSNAIATTAMMKEAKRLGYKPVLYSNNLQGEAREKGKMFVELVKPGEVLIAGGETTVQIRGSGIGGRNQEFALGALSSLHEDSLVLSCASDGIDHSSVAGAFVDDLVKQKAKTLGLKPESYLAKNDSFAFFQKTRSYLETGVTGMNVSDLMLTIRAR